MKAIKLLALCLAFSTFAVAQTKTKKSTKKVVKTEVVKPATVVKEEVKPATATAPQTPSQLKWDTVDYDFGNIDQGKPATVRFTFTNTTSKDVKLNDVKPACGCTAANFTRTAVKPGETGFVEAVFNAASAGPFTKNITVFTSEENSLPKVITFRGVVKTTTVATDNLSQDR
jgi:Protein of unknown function (DUF1573)